MANTLITLIATLLAPMPLTIEPTADTLRQAINIEVEQDDRSLRGVQGIWNEDPAGTLNRYYTARRFYIADSRGFVYVYGLNINM